MAKKAYYHRESNPAHELFIVRTNDDKTVDLARAEDAAPIVTRCAITEAPVCGSCTLTPPAAPTATEPGEPLEGEAVETTTKKKK